MGDVIDFTTRKTKKEIDDYLAAEGSSLYMFGCPDCESIDFNIYLDCTASCSDCGLEILLQAEDSELE